MLNEEDFGASKRDCPLGPILTTPFVGNLGNNIWEYMSVYVMSAIYNRKLYVKPYIDEMMRKRLEKVFEPYVYSLHVKLY